MIDFWTNGYRCGCGQWVAWGTYHYCNQQSDSTQWSWQPINLQSILDRLDQIEKQLEKLGQPVEAILEVTEMRESARDVLLARRAQVKSDLAKNEHDAENWRSWVEAATSAAERSRIELEEIEATLREGGVEFGD